MFRKKEMNARQAQQKNKDAQQEYFETRYALRTGDKDAAAMLTDYKRRYSAWVGNIAELDRIAQDQLAK